MAKVTFTKLGLKVNQEIKTIEYNGQVIEIKQYLPLEQKLELIANVINLSHDEKGYSNPIKVDVYTFLEILDYYTNISFTEKQREDVYKIHDTFTSSGLKERIYETMDQKELEDIKYCIKVSIEAVYAYQNSVMGVLENVKEDYSDTNYDIKDFQNILKSEDFNMIKDVISKLG